jgi:general secretion pathway protein I
VTRRHRQGARGFTLVEVLVALMIVAMGLAALLVAVSGAARTTGYLRDKTLAQWIALNRVAEVRLNVNKLGSTADTGEVQFANRTWHYDTRYYDTSITSMKRITVRVYAGDAKAKGNPLAETTGFIGQALGTPGSSNTGVDWTQGETAASSLANGASGAALNGTNGTTTPGATTPNTPTSTTTTPQSSQP